MKTAIITASLAVIILAVTSCETFDVTGKVYYVDPDSGAKGGIDLAKGKKPSVWLRLPTFKTNKGGFHAELEPVSIDPQK